MRLWATSPLLWVCCLCALAAAANDESGALAHAEKARQLTIAARYADAIIEWRQALRIAPGNAVFHNLYGLTLQQAGEPGPARAEFREALRLKSAFADAQNNLAYSLWESGASKEAAVEADRALRLSPGDGSLHLLRGEMFAQAAQHDQACREFRRAVPWPREAATLWRILESCLNAGDRARYLSAAKDLPVDARTQMNIGVWLLTSNQAADAIPFLTKALMDQELRRRAAVLLAGAFLAACDPGKALDALAGAGGTGEYQIRDLRGEALLALGRKAEAEAEFQMLVEEFPESPEAYIAATQVALEEKRWDDVLAVLNAGLDRNPNQWLLLFRRGMAYKLSGHAEQARNDLMAAMRADGDVSLVAAALGDLDAEGGDLAAAAELFQSTWKRTGLPQFQLAYAMALDRMGRPGDAVEQLRQMTVEERRSAQVHYSLGKVLAHEGSAREALAEFEKVRQLAPGLAVNLYALGHLYLVLGEPEKARAIMAEFQEAKRQPAPTPCRPG